MSTLRAWPYGFWDDLWRYGNKEVPIPFKSEEMLIATIEYVIAIAPLDDRDRRILHSRYKEHLSITFMAE